MSLFEEVKAELTIAERTSLIQKYKNAAKAILADIQRRKELSKQISLQILEFGTLVNELEEGYLNLNDVTLKKTNQTITDLNTKLKLLK